MTLIGLILVLILVAGAVLVAFRIVPAYIDYFTIQHSLESILSDKGGDLSDGAIRTTLDARLNVNYIEGMSSKDLEISRDHGTLTLTMPITRKEHLVGGVSVCVDLEATASTSIGR
jgi:hypothetical protein